MAKPNEIKYSQAALLIDTHVCQRIQSVGFSTDLNSEDVRELSNSSIVEVVDGVPSVSITIDKNEFGSINIENALSGFYDASDNTNYSFGIVADASFAEVASDVMLCVKEASSDTTTSRALWLSNCYIDSISGTCQVDGFATQSISMSGSAQSWFLNAYRTARVKRANYVDTTTIRPVSVTDITSVVAVTENGVRISSSYWGMAATKDVTSTGGYVFTSGSRYRVVYLVHPAAHPTVSDSASTSKVGGVKEQEIDMYLYDSSTDVTPTVGSSSYRRLRVQSVDYEIAFDRESLKQLYNGEYARGLNETNITATVTVLDSDLEMYAKTAKKDFSTSNEIALSDFQASKSLVLRIDIHNTKAYTTKSASTLLKSINFNFGKVTNTGDSFDVPGRGTTTFDLKFTSMYFTGTGKVGR